MIIKRNFSIPKEDINKFLGIIEMRRKSSSRNKYGILLSYKKTGAVYRCLIVPTSYNGQSNEPLFYLRGDDRLMIYPPSSYLEIKSGKNVNTKEISSKDKKISIRNIFDYYMSR